MKFTVTAPDGTVTELERIDVQDGDILRVPDGTDRETLEPILEHLAPRRVLILVGDVPLVLTDEERLHLARHLLQRDGG